MGEHLDETAALIAELRRIATGKTKRLSCRVVCEHHPRFDPARSAAGVLPPGENAGGNVYHQVYFEVPDDHARVQAADKLLNRLLGRPGTRPAPRGPGAANLSALEQLSDEELAALAGEEVDHGEAQGGAAERAAG